MATKKTTKIQKTTQSKADAGDADVDNLDAENINFEEALAELETLVAQMEGGDLSLDESLKAFERGVRLTRQCQQVLSAAELKVRTLSASGELEPAELAALDDSAG